MMAGPDYWAAVGILGRAWRAGVRLTADGDSIRFAGKATPDLLTDIRKHKAAIVSAIRWHLESAADAAAWAR